MIRKTWQGWEVYKKDGNGRTLYIASIYKGEPTWVTDYAYAKHYSKKVAEKHNATFAEEADEVTRLVNRLNDYLGKKLVKVVGCSVRVWNHEEDDEWKDIAEEISCTNRDEVISTLKGMMLGIITERLYTD